VRLDENHSFGDVWREIGAIYLRAGRLKDAEQCLSKFVDRREYDPEGLYVLGETLMKLNRGAEARAYFDQMRKWSKLAQGQLSKLPD
jgi:predicted Zn-dependent protease